MRTNSRRNNGRSRRTAVALALLGSTGSPAPASQVDLHGPPNSVTFGSTVAALPNGNFVVFDPDYGPKGRKLGAVYVFGPTGSLISKLQGNTDGDRVGSGNNPYLVSVLANGNFVVLSPSWSNGKAAAAGAVTVVDGNVGLTGIVSPDNSLVGTQTGDQVGNGGVVLLANGNFVVSSYSWSNGSAGGAGAVTWIAGDRPLTGAVTINNSLVGTEAQEGVGASLATALSTTALANGNYVVANPNWRLSAGRLGAVMLADGSIGAIGTFSESNSLTGAVAGDSIGSGGVIALRNGNFVVASPTWNNGSVQSAGAVTWVDGTVGLVEMVSAGNSLVGSSFDDFVGSSFTLHPIVALTNGNYVVASSWWSNRSIRHVGAVTWGDGSKGISGPISPVNSLVGSVENDQVGYDRVAALSNGNYVVGSRYWHNGAVDKAGAVTWADGTKGLTGPVSTANSLVGAREWDWVGSQGIRALTNGNYVVTTPRWSSDTAPGVGAITWADGSTGITGLISSSNSLVGSTPGDGIGAFNVAVLSNGNYIVDSPDWNHGTATLAGAITWADGATGLSGPVTMTNSLIGTTANDEVGYNLATSLPNGNYVVASPYWSSDVAASVGAVTWGNGRSGISGPVSAANSLIGSSAGDNLGSGYEHDPGFRTYANGTYVIGSPQVHNGAIAGAGAVSLIRGSGGTIGPVNPGNSVIGRVAGGGESMVFDYDPSHDTLIVGQPAANVVTLLRADLLFWNGFQ